MMFIVSTIALSLLVSGAYRILCGSARGWRFIGAGICVGFFGSILEGFVRAGVPGVGFAQAFTPSVPMLAILAVGLLLTGYFQYRNRIAGRPPRRPDRTTMNRIDLPAPPSRRRRRR